MTEQKKRKASADEPTTLATVKRLQLRPSVVSISDQLKLLQDADFRYFAEFEKNHHSLFLALRSTIPFQREHSIVHGKRFPQPRLTCFLGDPNRVYSYSGIRRRVFPMSEPLKAFMNKVSAHVQTLYPDHPPYTSVIANYYASGKDSIGVHSDNENGLVKNSVIASITLGTTRSFVIYNQDNQRVCSLPLASGSLLIMGKNTQKLYKHAVPRALSVAGDRLNLTFRVVEPSIA